ncbi:hypothetical protein BOX15_Mlig020230g2 [Macrostomum lignano]|uniref:Dienelactone hydrolase domain-containing protein n=1 Tax=Macrostomum lignano TaxID=282301 RepID=A0A267GK45_9PLAT|nr:hypothetical protein BOX15_Mlig020230g2 [Macrostomum lignano]
MATEVCCSSGSPSNNSNSGSGSIVTDSGVRNYITGSGKGRGLVLIHDIFGLDIGQTRQFADDLAAKAEATVVMPDLFHGGEAWSLARFPPPDKTEFGNWLSTTANADKAAKAILDQTVPLLKQRIDPSAKLALLGFCWGAKPAMLLAAAAGSPFACAASAHPAFLTADLVRAVRMPIALLPASDDPDMQKLLEELRDQPFYSRCVHRRYDGVSHGFCAARGDRNDAKQMEKILDARDTLAKFFIDNA